MNPPDEPDGPAFWEMRLRRYGHTGWADPATYLYDQCLRLKAVGDVLAALPLAAKTRRALDYGCGVGDFSRLLAHRVDRVVGFDVSPDIIERAQRLNPGPNIRYTARLEEALGGAGTDYDLILSITVLQHVTDDAALQRLIDSMAAALDEGGTVIVLETFAQAERGPGI